MRLMKTFIRNYRRSTLWGNYHSGNPVLFGSHWFDYLQQIQGDQGGKTIIHGDGKAHVVKLWISDDIGDDIDTPDDFERLKHRESEAL